MWKLSVLRKSPKLVSCVCTSSSKLCLSVTLSRSELEKTNWKKMLPDIHSGNATLDSLVVQWLHWDDRKSESFATIKSMAQQEKWDDLEKIMLKRQSFGTAGIRGRMGPGFAQLNDLVIIQTSQGLANYVLSSSPSPIKIKEGGVVIGFDARYNSERWAKLTARVFLRLGYKVYLFSSITPTPFVPFTVQRKKASVGIMITASHNPKGDNGYKVYWNNGPQIKPPLDKLILDTISAHMKPEDEHAFDDDMSAFNSEELVDPLGEISNAYYKTLQQMLYDPVLSSSYRGRVVYTAMHGVGANFLDKAFQVAGFLPVIHVQEQREPDPDFPTVEFPNPEEGKSALDLAVRTADANRAKYILANDPDADRLAVAEKVNGRWKIFNGNEMGALLGWWQLQVHRNRFGADHNDSLYFIASTVSSKMLGAIAAKEDAHFIETLTGFKWMANYADELEKTSDKNKVLLAYEEAIGFMCGTQVLDKDGVTAAVRLAELMAYLDSQNRMTLSEKLDEIYKTYGYHCNRDSYFVIRDHEDTERIFRRLRDYDNGSPNTYPQDLKGKYKVVAVRDLTTGYDSSVPNHIATLPADPKSQMITFKFDNGVVATLRTSGTEPKLKYYAEYCGKPGESDWQRIENDLDQIVEDIIDGFLEPTKNNLGARPS